MNRSSAALTLSTAILSTAGLSLAALLSPIGSTSAQAAGSLFSEQAVDESQFVVMAAPRNEVDYNLVVLEQKSGRRDCWTESDGVINPLLLNFDFSGICGRATDSNGYSVRMAGEDLGLKYSLRLVDRGSYVALLAAPNRRNQSTLEIGRTKASGQDYLAIELNPGWNLSRRVYDGKALGHIYFSNETALANTVAVAPADRPITAKPVTAKPVAPKPVPSQPVAQPVVQPTSEAVVVGQPLPKPPALPSASASDNAAPAPIALPVEQPPTAVIAVDPASPAVEAPVAIPVEAAPDLAIAPNNGLAERPHYAELNALYQQILDRSVDPSGLATYGKRIDQGKSLDWVSDRLRNSDEGRAIAINRLYREVLGRDADASGLRTYSKRLKRGWTISQLRRHLAQERQADQRLANR